MGKEQSLSHKLAGYGRGALGAWRATSGNRATQFLRGKGFPARQSIYYLPSLPVNTRKFMVAKSVDFENKTADNATSAG